MDFGIYFAYWENEWSGDYHAYIDRVADIGFDVLEISCASIPEKKEDLICLRNHARERGIKLTAGYGPTIERDLSSEDQAVVDNGKKHLLELIRKLEIMDIKVIGGGLYSYWPVDYSKKFDKKRRWDAAVKNMRDMAIAAEDYGVTLCMETLNRFETYMINTAKECRQFVEEVDHKNVGIMLDTFHMNIEEDSFRDAIVIAGDLLRHVHLGEANRKVPGKGRLPWKEIGCALNQISYEGACVMEPFVMQGGTIGHEIRIWHEIEENITQEALDEDAKNSLKFIKSAFQGNN